MTPTIPLQFLVGVTRLIAVYFGLRSLEAISVLVVHDMMQKDPSIWAMFLPAVAIYLTPVVLVWFTAPFICRLAVGSSTVVQPEASQDLCWSEVMIFLVGTLFVGWGMTRFADALAPILQLQVRNLDHKLSYADELKFFMTAALMGFGAVLMARFPSIFRWMQRRRLQ